MIAILADYGLFSFKIILMNNIKTKILKKRKCIDSTVKDPFYLTLYRPSRTLMCVLYAVTRRKTRHQIWMQLKQIGVKYSPQVGKSFAPCILQIVFAHKNERFI